jgi:NAD(P)-dependent dehydrogenase (short-subunit alcohol dehydrogenase family)
MNADQLFEVRGQVAIVTGAASGIGLAMAEVMAANGAAVTLVDIDRPGLDAVVTRLRASGAEVESVTCDVKDLDRLAATIDATALRRGRLDAVFANAGISAGPGFAFGPAGGIEGIALPAWQNVLDINLTSVLTTLKAATPHMKARRYGRMIVTASIAGIKSEPFVGYAYAATKAAVINVVRHAATELAPFNISVNAIAPGAFMTNIAGGRLRFPEVAKQFAAMSPMQRIASTDEMKGLILLLGSPASSFLTGQVIAIDGGATAS